MRVNSWPSNSGAPGRVAFRLNLVVHNQGEKATRIRSASSETSRTISAAGCRFLTTPALWPA